MPRRLPDDGVRATRRLDRAIEQARYHGEPPAHRCSQCEVEVLRATLGLLAEAMVQGHLVWIGEEAPGA